MIRGLQRQEVTSGHFLDHLLSVPPHHTDGPRPPMGVRPQFSIHFPRTLQGAEMMNPFLIDEADQVGMYANVW